jgi:spermidine/putrescine transport system substrate-binding protein
MLPEEVRTNDDSYPDLSKLNNMEIFLDPGDFIDEYNRIWTEFRAE